MAEPVVLIKDKRVTYTSKVVGCSYLKPICKVTHASIISNSFFFIKLVLGIKLSVFHPKLLSRHGGAWILYAEIKAPRSRLRTAQELESHSAPSTTYFSWEPSIWSTHQCILICSPQVICPLISEVPPKPGEARFLGAVLAETRSANREMLRPPVILAWNTTLQIQHQNKSHEHTHTHTPAAAVACSKHARTHVDEHACPPTQTCKHWINSRQRRVDGCRM